MFSCLSPSVCCTHVPHASYRPIFHQFVESFTDFGEVGSEGSVWVIQFAQELRVGVMVEDVADAIVRFGGEVGVDQLQQNISALCQVVRHHSLVKGKIHLIEADGRHGSRMELFLKILGEFQFLVAETVISIQHANLDSDLDQVFNDFLSHRLVSCVLLGNTVQFVHYFAGGVVYKSLHRAFVGHAAEDFLLCLHGQILGAECLHSCLSVC